MIGRIPIIKIANIVSPNIELQNAQYYSGEINTSMKRCLVESGDILISMTGSHVNQINSAVGKIGRYNYSTPAILNQRVGKLKPKIECSQFLYGVMLQEETQKEILMAATGSANQANISPETIKSVKIKKPLQQTLNQYEQLGNKIYKNIDNYEIEIRALGSIKDLLLSKLATIEN